jgi:hypothetical protein
LRLGNVDEAARLTARAVTLALEANHHDTATVLVNAGGIFEAASRTPSTPRT